MKFTINSVKDGEQAIEVELLEMEMENYYDQAIKKISKEINIKGFRPGKIPTKVVETHVNNEIIKRTAIEMAIPISYAEMIEQHKIEAIGKPKVEIITQWPLKYKAIIPVYPEVTVKNPEKIILIPKTTDVSEPEIEEELIRIKRSQSKFQKANKPAKMGDRVEIDFSGFDEQGVALENTSSKNHPLILGDNSFVPGFEEQVVGMSTGEKKEIKVTFPADYFHEPFRNKVVIFKVKLVLHEIMTLPEIDKDFIKRVGGKSENADEFRMEIKENLKQRKEFEESQRLEGELLGKILQITEVKVPESLIEEEIEEMIEIQKNDMAKKGVEFKQFLEATGQTIEDLKKSKQKEAESRLKLRFGINQAFKQLNIHASKEEVEKAMKEELQILASMNFKPELSQINSLYPRLESRIKMKKLLELITQKK